MYAILSQFTCREMHLFIAWKTEKIKYIFVDTYMNLPLFFCVCANVKFC